MLHWLTHTYQENHAVPPDIHALEQDLFLSEVVNAFYHLDLNELVVKSSVAHVHVLGQVLLVEQPLQSKGIAICDGLCKGNCRTCLVQRWLPSMTPYTKTQWKHILYIKPKYHSWLSRAPVWPELLRKSICTKWWWGIDDTFWWV